MSLDLCFQPATELARRVREGELSARELVTAHLKRIERLNPRVNALCTLVADRALDEAAEADHGRLRGEPTGPLHGLPIAVKDLELTRGIRTTFGSSIYRDFVPDRDALFVERLKTAGAIIIGKTNTPELGAGSQTFNEVFGETLNPYDLAKTCGGSTGGGAAALACGMVPLADGSDLGGSLRNPASFCNVVGFRPSPGRVPIWPAKLGWQTLKVLGPMARTVSDAALLLSVMAGPDPRSPISLSERGSTFHTPLEHRFEETRLAWTADLGRYPVEREVVETCERALAVFRELGCHVEEAHPDLSGADEVFQTLRAWLFAAEHREDLHAHRSQMKDTVVWNIEKGLALDGVSVARAEAARTDIYHRARVFLERYEFLLLPVSQVLPFAVEQRYVTEINGIPMKTYVDWMASCYCITLTGLPAISVPCGFTTGGLPVGLQIVGRPRADLDVLRLAYAFEQETRFSDRHPPLAL